ncbi:MAG: YjbQ family protein [Candidatus Aenigmatarchaeota archaeon]|nr:MAG: YjbQ family protein [Candidatus Aenigmarchaeota archaeon]
MKVFQDSFSIETESGEFYNITEKVEEIVEKSGVKSGLCNVSVPGSTGVIAVNEDERMLKQDFRDSFEDIAPSTGLYQHPDNAYSHIRALFLGSEKTLPVKDGKLLLGTWQSIFLIEMDNGPRKRSVQVTVIGE